MTQSNVSVLIGKASSNNEPRQKTNTRTIFYSWQSDVGKARRVIEGALSHVKEYVGRPDIQIKVDQDTRDMPGAPDIGITIQEKIEACDAFVADVTFINESNEGRRTPNPNVMFELGYAMKALGSSRVVLAMDADCGDVNDLPFDIRQLRVTSFSLANGLDAKAKAQQRIARNVAETINQLEGDWPTSGAGDQASSRERIAGTLVAGMRRIATRYMIDTLKEAVGRIQTDSVVAHEFATKAKAYMAQLEEADNEAHVVVTDELIAETETLAGQITDRALFEIRDMLKALQASSSNWKYDSGNNKLAARYIHPLYLAFGEKMGLLDPTAVLTEHFAEIVEELAPAERLALNETGHALNGAIAFSDKPNGFVVNRWDGQLIAKGLTKTASSLVSWITGKAPTAMLANTYEGASTAMA